jgi:hypothetical protein
MISLMVEFALFFLVMFFFIPALMVFVLTRRDPFHPNRKHSSEAG